ncbi:MAG: DUF4062 domain-containing protein [Bacteroidota bacterium]
MPQQTYTVMVSSTARDLPDYRQEVWDAIARLSMLPVIMEHLSAADANAVTESLSMVDRADIYVGILAHRYGTIPEGHDKRRWSTARPPSILRSTSPSRK